ncbi:peptidase M75 family protein [Kineosporia sp. J2-2]|uniref:Peptidase M75 family protein n=1 Tax=Kineosporia corallincola TaxID=2835133 RepID=A0ABS5TQ36_9ACTN|nr:iron uptake system protein EfeO [Kineosporia corallincola]MBT0773224.1 peptidase M75 family protein [Kineosporia corallincola]
MPVRSARQLTLAAVTAGLVVGVTACGGSSSGTGSTSAAASGDAHTANVTVTAADGCTPDRTEFEAGAITFNVTNQDATAVSEVELLGGQRIIGEKENLPPGFDGTFSVSVPAGSYTLYCPGATTENTTLTVTGTASSSADSSLDDLYETGTTQYAAYINDQVGYLVTTTADLAEALHGTDLEAAQEAYAKARPYYEKVEAVAESFTAGDTDLDAAIDARDGDVPAADWTGFHPIEKGLFDDKSLDGLGDLGDGLAENATKLQELTKDLTYQPYELANGAQELLDEVASSKITGEEERYSHIDLLDFSGNLEGAQQAFADLEPALDEIDSSLSDQVATNFSALSDLLKKYEDADALGGYTLYGDLSSSDKKAFAAAVKAVQEPLSRVAAKVTH